jgi:hypothetical protein
MSAEASRRRPPSLMTTAGRAIARPSQRFRFGCDGRRIVVPDLAAGTTPSPNCSILRRPMPRSSKHYPKACEAPSEFAPDCNSWGCPARV